MKESLSVIKYLKLYENYSLSFYFNNGLANE